MPLKLKPFEIPRSANQPGRSRIQPLQPGEVTSNTGPLEKPFSLSDTEKYLFAHFAAEHCRIIGTACYFFSQRVAKSTRDPLYDEPLDRVWSKAYHIKAWVSWVSTSPVVGEEGFRYAFEGRVWIPKHELERVQAPVPFEGDVIGFWDNPYFDETSTAGDKLEKSGYYFDIINADSDGHINDSPSFVGFQCDVRRNSSFAPERRIIAP